MANNWKTLHGEPIPDIYHTIRDEVEKADENGWTIFAYVGTDGQDIGSKFTRFVQCIAIRRFDSVGVGKGGRVFYIRHMESRYWDMSTKLLREAELSINLAQKISPLFDELGVPFEVHADVNSYCGNDQQNKSNKIHDAVKGWVTGLGYKCKTKPYSFVATHAADRLTRSVKYRRNKNG